MLKRILCCIFVLVALSAVFIPAFAIGDTGPDATVYAGLQFDTISSYGGAYADAVASWPFNEYSGFSALVGSEGYESSIQYFSACVFGSSSAIRGYFNCRDAEGFVLYSENLFFDASSSLYISGEDVATTTFPRVIVEYDVVSILPNSIETKYQTYYHHVRYDSSLDPVSGDLSSGGRLNIRDVILRAFYVENGSTLFDHFELTPGSTLLLEDVTIKVFYTQDPQDSGFWVEATASSGYRNHIGSWIASQSIPVDSDGGFNMFGWLLTTADAFLSLEIFPGFSFRLILMIVVLIGVLGLAFKMLS